MRVPFNRLNSISFITLSADLEKKELKINYHVLSSSRDLTIDEKRVFDAAVMAMANAYAPYSKFNVGCALLLENDEIIIGNNQENIAYPSGLCAERVALFSASANFPGVPIKILVVVAQPLAASEEMSITPCGSCRQVMVEYERVQKKPMRIITGAANGKLIAIDSSKFFLPLAFFDSGLTKD